MPTGATQVLHPEQAAVLSCQRQPMCRPTKQDWAVLRGLHFILQHVHMTSLRPVLCHGDVTLEITSDGRAPAQQANVQQQYLDSVTWWPSKLASFLPDRLPSWQVFPLMACQAGKLPSWMGYRHGGWESRLFPHEILVWCHNARIVCGCLPMCQLVVSYCFCLFLVSTLHCACGMLLGNWHVAFLMGKFFVSHRPTTSGIVKVALCIKPSSRR